MKKIPALGENLLNFIIFADMNGGLTLNYMRALNPVKYEYLQIDDHLLKRQIKH